VALLGDHALNDFLARHPEWTVVGGELVRVFTFPDFGSALGFVVRVGAAAEKANHHPDIDLRWNRVVLRLSTHSAGGITEKDTEMATSIGSY
jgi:4a-hydroxytetrahydrobiopterin dehydratase